VGRGEARGKKTADLFHFEYRGRGWLHVGVFTRRLLEFNECMSSCWTSLDNKAALLCHGVSNVN